MPALTTDRKTPILLERVLWYLRIGSILHLRLLISKE